MKHGRTCVPNCHDGAVMDLQTGGRSRLSEGAVMALPTGGRSILSEGVVMALPTGGRSRLSKGVVMALPTGGRSILSEGAVMALLTWGTRDFDLEIFIVWSLNILIVFLIKNNYRFKNSIFLKNDQYSKIKINNLSNIIFTIKGKNNNGYY